MDYKRPRINDGDGLIHSPAEPAVTPRSTPPSCDNGIDDDDDGFTDSRLVFGGEE